MLCSIFFAKQRASPVLLQVYSYYKSKTYLTVLCAESSSSYVIVYCSGYIMPWLTTVLNRSNNDEDTTDAETSISCLVALAVPVDFHGTEGGSGLATPTYVAMTSTTDVDLLKTTAEFFSRHTTDGKFTFVDHRPALFLSCINFVPCKEIVDII